MRKHTPGPWTIDDDIIVGPSGFVIASITHADDLPCVDPEVDDTDAIDAECEANARLIASAPELLEFAKTTFNSTNCTCKFLGYVGKEPPCERCQLGVLIAKAEAQ